ncbi:nucleoprotein [Wenling hoplichthys paramyxovirus]|uniref:Nucleocapsid n=1 Tax=Wenling hoplichthys paramyxovirus TaxID=2116453 RepID=A0A2P1GN21_9MONO|nr:nucleoprotein [Wenling hoplichthys paramyxovirus]AVM87392.1 nucleoprotein [Wenling hoplichthys paramyxovirus]
MSSARDNLEVHSNNISKENLVKSQPRYGVAHEKATGVRSATQDTLGKNGTLWVCLTIIINPKMPLSSRLGSLATIAGLVFGGQDNTVSHAKSSQVDLTMHSHPRITASGGMGTLDQDAEAHHIDIHETFTKNLNGITTGQTSLARSGSSRLLTDMLVQISYILSKAVTNKEKAEGHCQRLFDRRVSQERSDGNHAMTPEMINAFVRLFNESLAARKIWAQFLVWTREIGTSGNEATQAVAPIGVMMENLGLTGFSIAMEVALNKQLTELDSAAYHSNMVTLNNLLVLIRAKGREAKIMYLSSDPDMMNFLPSRFSKVYSFAIGYKREIDESFGGYNHTGTHIDAASLEEGKRAAERVMNEEMEKRKETFDDK